MIDVKLLEPNVNDSYFSQKVCYEILGNYPLILSDAVLSVRLICFSQGASCFVNLNTNCRTTYSGHPSMVKLISVYVRIFRTSFATEGNRRALFPKRTT